MLCFTIAYSDCDCDFPLRKRKSLEGLQSGESNDLQVSDHKYAMHATNRREEGAMICVAINLSRDGRFVMLCRSWLHIDPV